MFVWSTAALPLHSGGMSELNLDELAIFVRVVELGSFANAARELKAPTSTVSRAIARLETRAGVRLLQRSTRSVRATSEGNALFASVAPALGTLRSALHTLEPATSKPKGRLRVTAPSDLCSGFFADAIVAFAEKYPLVQLDFSLSNQQTNQIREGFDVALRATAQLGDSSFSARKLGEIEHGLFASPRYLEQHGTPESPQSLPRHRCLVFRAEQLVRTWKLASKGDESAVEVQGKIGGDDFSFVRAMALSGGGIALLPRMNCVRDEASGRLVRVLPEYHARGASLYVVYPSSKNLPSRVRAFRDFVIEAFAAFQGRSGSSA
jgi:DNA-binding transcriptional LysR family regulator